MTATNDLALLVLSAGLSLRNACNRTPKAGSIASSPQREEIALLRAADNAFNRGELDAAVEPLSSEIEWSEPARFRGRSTYHGREGAKKYLSQSR